MPVHRGAAVGGRKVVDDGDCERAAERAPKHGPGDAPLTVTRAAAPPDINSRRMVRLNAQATGGTVAAAEGGRSHHARRLRGASEGIAAAPVIAAASAWQSSAMNSRHASAGGRCVPQRAPARVHARCAAAAAGSTQPTRSDQDASAAVACFASSASCPALAAAWLHPQLLPSHHAHDAAPAAPIYHSARRRRAGSFAHCVGAQHHERYANVVQRARRDRAPEEKFQHRLMSGGGGCSSGVRQWRRAWELQQEQQKAAHDGSAASAAHALRH
jgi:hypothetical protein